MKAKQKSEVRGQRSEAGAAPARDKVKRNKPARPKVKGAVRIALVTAIGAKLAGVAVTKSKSKSKLKPKPGPPGGGG